MSDFVIVKIEHLSETVQNSGAIFDQKTISMKELSMMHLSSMQEILAGRKSDLNFKLYKATKNYIDDHINELMESRNDH